MTRIPTYRAQMLARKARKAGCTVDELLASGERLAERGRRISEITSDRRTSWRILEQRSVAYGRWWWVATVCEQRLQEIP